MTNLNEKTTVSISLVIIIASLVAWAVRVEVHASGDKEEIAKVTNRINKSEDAYHEILQRLTRIEAKLDKGR